MVFKEDDYKNTPEIQAFAAELLRVRRELKTQENRYAHLYGGVIGAVERLDRLIEAEANGMVSGVLTHVHEVVRNLERTVKAAEKIGPEYPVIVSQDPRPASPESAALVAKLQEFADRRRPTGVDALKSLPPDELAEIPRLTEEEIRAALEEGRQNRAAAERAMGTPGIDPGRRYR